jgi:hypothetical protein
MSPSAAEANFFASGSGGNNLPSRAHLLQKETSGNNLPSSSTAEGNF